MIGIWQDVRFGVRVLAAHRQFTFVAMAILAVGVGATTAVFSVINAVLLRPLPYRDPSALVAFVSLYKSPETARRTPVVALTDVAEWRTRSRSFASMGAFAYTELAIRAGDRALSPVTALVDPEFLPTLGNPLHLGTQFEPGAAKDMSAIISHALWTDVFGADPAAIGKPIVIDGDAYTLRGVLGPDFQFPRSDASYNSEPVALLVPSSSFTGFPPQSRQWFGIGRLGAGVTTAQARAELQSVAEGVAAPEAGGGVWSVDIAPLNEETTRRARQPLIVVLGVAIVLLLIASSNLMNLFFSRATARVREIAIRRAVGGSTARLLRQLIVETLLLAAAGGGLGVLLAVFALDAIVALSPVHLPVSGAITIDRTVLMFTMAICAGAALTASLFPALQLRRSADAALGGMGTRASATRAVTRLQQSLCVFQIALGVALLAVAGLLANSLWRLNAVDPGFNPEHVMGFNVSVPTNMAMGERQRFYAAALDEIRTIPGVSGAGLISFMPPETRAGVFMGVGIEGVPPPGPNEPPRVANTLVSSAGYFSTLEMPMAGGRDFTEGDTADARPVIVVNEAFARRYFPNGDALGRRIGTGFDRLKPVRQIVGIVSDTHDRGLAVAAIPTVYVPFTQFALPYGSMVVRARVDLAAAVPVIRDRLTRLNPDVPVADFQRLADRIRESLREPRFYTLMAATCALMAVFFVSFGLYGLVSYSVSRRTAEVGIRMAVGANRGAILAMILGQGLRLSAAGVAAGLALAYAGTRVLRTQLFEVQPTDPLTLAAASAVVVLVTLAASYAPAHRASRVNPLTALRHE